jgi:hypothetical protein
MINWTTMATTKAMITAAGGEARYQRRGDADHDQP